MNERAEREYIEMEAARIDSSERYFNARPQIDNADRRKVFESGFDRGWQAAIASQAKDVLPNQEPLGSEFEKVLYENLDSLYETAVATQPASSDRVRGLGRKDYPAKCPVTMFHCSYPECSCGR